MDRDELRDERNHWIGEAKRYERLYRYWYSSSNGTRWWRERNDARAEADRLRARLTALEDGVRALADLFDPEHDGHDATHGHPDCEGCIHADLRALLDAAKGGGDR